MRKNLKLFRTSKDLTQKEMARTLLVSRSTYNKIERGLSDTKSDFFERLQKTFDLTDQEKGELMKNEPQEKSESD